jgi:hypothetical protein
VHCEDDIVLRDALSNALGRARAAAEAHMAAAEAAYADWHETTVTDVALLVASPEPQTRRSSRVMFGLQHMLEVMAAIGGLGPATWAKGSLQSASLK